MTALREALDVLREVEWEGKYLGRQCCPSCGGLPPLPPGVAREFTLNDDVIGHYPDCRLAAALASHPVSDPAPEAPRCPVPNCHAGMLRDQTGRDSASCPVCDGRLPLMDYLGYSAKAAAVPSSERETRGTALHLMLNGACIRCGQRAEKIDGLCRGPAVQGADNGSGGTGGER